MKRCFKNNLLITTFRNDYSDDNTTYTELNNIKYKKLLSNREHVTTLVTSLDKLKNNINIRIYFFILFHNKKLISRFILHHNFLSRESNNFLKSLYVFLIK